MKSRVKSVSKSDIFVTIVFLTGLYTGLEWKIAENIPIPFFISGIAALYMAIINIYKVKSSHLIWLVFLYIVTLIGSLFSGSITEGHVRGLLQLIYSSITGYVFFLHMIKIPKKTMSKIFFIFTIVVLTGSFLEVYTPLKAISDDFRHNAYETGMLRYVYENDKRDITLHGHIRPKFFTAEPSYVAKFFVLTLLSWFCLSQWTHWRRYVYFTFFVIVGLLVISSPIILLAIPMAVIAEVLLRRKFNPRLVFLSIVGGVITILAVIFIFSTRIEQISKLADQSFIIRLVAPVLTTFHLSNENLLWGIGVRGEEIIAQLIYNIYEHNLGIKIDRLNVFNNLLWLFVIYYGIIGGILFLFGLGRLMRSLGVENLKFVFLMMLGFSQVMGGFVDLRTWGYLFTVAGVASYKQN